MMKKIIYGALAMTLTFGTISCSDFLDLAPINKITENDIEKIFDHVSKVFYENMSESSPEVISTIV